MRLTNSAKVYGKHWDELSAEQQRYIRDYMALEVLEMEEKAAAQGADVSDVGDDIANYL